jgi:hypothetical protein
MSIYSYTLPSLEADSSYKYNLRWSYRKLRDKKKDDSFLASQLSATILAFVMGKRNQDFVFIPIHNNAESL